MGDSKCCQHCGDSQGDKVKLFREAKRFIKEINENIINDILRDDDQFLIISVGEQDLKDTGIVTKTLLDCQKMHHSLIKVIVGRVDKSSGDSLESSESILKIIRENEKKAALENFNIVETKIDLASFDYMNKSEGHIKMAKFVYQRTW
jgi:hypothetical protein